MQNGAASLTYILTFPNGSDGNGFGQRYYSTILPEVQLLDTNQDTKSHQEIRKDTKLH